MMQMAMSMRLLTSVAIFILMAPEGLVAVTAGTDKSPGIQVRAQPTAYNPNIWGQLV